MTDSIQLPPVTAATCFPRVRTAARRGWGRFPEVSLAASCGLFLVTLGYNAGRADSPFAGLFYWVGMLVVFVPISARLFGASATDKERFGLVLELGLLLYLVKMMYSPLEFKFSDEFQHWRSTADILESGRLYTLNSLLRVSPYYPGLENITAALCSLTGLSIFSAGVAVTAVARGILVATLYLAYVQIGGSTRVAGFAAGLYMTNAHFLFINAMYTYQAPAMALFGLVLLGAARWERQGRAADKMLVIGGILALTVTHHVTSYALLGFLGLWTVTATWVRRRRPGQPLPGGLCLLSLVTMLGWLGYKATMTIPYLSPSVGTAAGSLRALLFGGARVNQLFQGPGGPVEEALINMGSVALTAALLPPAIFFVWRRYHTNALALTLAAGSLGYFAVIAMRVVVSQAELAGRSWPFLFIFTSFALSAGGVEAARSPETALRALGGFSGSLLRRLPALRGLSDLLARRGARAVKAARDARAAALVSAGCVAFAAMVFVGGIVGGWPPFWERLPGRYLVGASERSVEPESVRASYWAHDVLGPKNRIAADVINHLLMGSYGNQESNYGLAIVYFAAQFGPAEREKLQYYDIRYLLVDRRLATSVPIRGFYFNDREPDRDPYAFNYVRALEAASLEKFDGLPAVSRVFDSGSIQLYDVWPLLGR